MLTIYWHVVHTSYLSGAPGAVPVEKKIVMWRNLSTWQIVRWRNSPHDRLSCGKNSPHEKCEENLKCGEIMCTIYGVLSHFTIFCCKISIFAIYAVCREICFGTIYALLRGEKLSQKIGPVEKKWQIWGMMLSTWFEKVILPAGTGFSWSFFSLEYTVVFFRISLEYIFQGIFLNLLEYFSESLNWIKWGRFLFLVLTSIFRILSIFSKVLVQK